MAQMHNRQQKQMFLDSIQGNIALIDPMKSIFNSSYQFEQKYFRDLCEFNKSQMLDFLSSMDIDKKTLRTRRSAISRYIEYCIDKNIVTKNVLKELSPEEIASLGKERAINFDSDLIYDLVTPTRNEVTNMELKNIQDMLTVYLIFLGVSGKSLNVLRNLKYEHVDFENKIIRTSQVDENTSDVLVDDLCLYLIEESMQEDVYISYNTTDHGFEMQPSNYLIKKTFTGTAFNDEPISYIGLLKRITDIRDYLGIENFNTKNIEKTGMNFFGKMVLKKEGAEISIDNSLLNQTVFKRYNVTNQQKKYRSLRDIKENNKEIMS